MQTTDLNNPFFKGREMNQSFFCCDQHSATNVVNRDEHLLNPEHPFDYD